jgi:hypothetical protein
VLDGTCEFYGENKKCIKIWAGKPCGRYKAYIEEQYRDGS